MNVEQIHNMAIAGGRIPDDAAGILSQIEPADLFAVASAVRDRGHGSRISYSRKVFIPLTQLCRNSCHYCTFAHPPRQGHALYLAPAEVLAIAAVGARAGCKEALFTLGDKPELRYRSCAEWLAQHGYASTIAYLKEMAGLVHKETGLLPHINAGVMSLADIQHLRAVSVSQGLMLETSSERLSRRGGPHFGSPDKHPKVRLETIAAAGKARVPFTSGLLIGIGETRLERIEALLQLRALHDLYGHIQEIIIQNFRAKPGTRMADTEDAPLKEQLWTIIVARLLFGSSMNIQSPPNLRPQDLSSMVSAGINDWGGVSPVTPDHVNPEAPWPSIERLAAQTADAGGLLVERLAIYPSYANERSRWVDPGLQGGLLRHSDASGFARSDDWVAGAGTNPPHEVGARPIRASQELRRIVTKAVAGSELTETEIVSLFEARGPEFDFVCEAADGLRSDVVGNEVSYVVTRNINYTNICYFKCKFCAFSKGKLSENLRGRPYNLSFDEIKRRAAEAWERGATEVCLQGGIHPEYTGQTYLDICREIKSVTPDMHIHAFSPLEVWQGAATLGLSIDDFLRALKEAGLGSVPGTAAEVLDDEVRRIICPDKINTAQWLEVIATAHRIGLRSTATIMFGHVDRPENWARHLLHIRRLQARTGGFTEWVPLPFVPTETPIFLRNASRQGPTYREAVLMHAVGRLALHPLIKNVQASWVKLGVTGIKACLSVGVNDLGGTLMEETITRAAGAVHGQEISPHQFREIIHSVGRTPVPRTTLYGRPSADRIRVSLEAQPLKPSFNTPAVRYERTMSSALECNKSTVLWRNTDLASNLLTQKSERRE